MSVSVVRLRERRGSGRPQDRDRGRQCGARGVRRGVCVSMGRMSVLLVAGGQPASPPAGRCARRGGDRAGWSRERRPRAARWRGRAMGPAAGSRHAAGSAGRRCGRPRRGRRAARARRSRRGRPSMRASPGPSACRCAGARAAADDGHVQAVEARIGQQQQVGEGVLRADEAEGAEDGDRVARPARGRRGGRAPCRSRPCRAGARAPRPPAPARRAGPRPASESKSPMTMSGRMPAARQRAAPPSAAMTHGRSRVRCPALAAVAGLRQDAEAAGPGHASRQCVSATTSTSPSATMRACAWLAM